MPLRAKFSNIFENISTWSYYEDFRNLTTVEKRLLQSWLEVYIALKL